MTRREHSVELSPVSDVADAIALEFQVVDPMAGLPTTPGWIARRKRFFFAVGVIVLAIVGFALKRQGYLAPELVFGFLKTHPVLAPLVFVTLYIVMTVLLLPTLPLTLGAGFLWGPYWGCLYTVLGASLGAALAFLISRYLASDFINNRFRHRAWTWLIEQVESQSWKIIAFTRINPIFPSGPLNYFYGLTSIPFWRYFVSSVLFIIPTAFVFSYLGYSVGGFFLRGEAYHVVENLLGVSAAVTALIALRLVMMRYFRSSPGR